MPWVEWKPLLCPACGTDWRRPRSHLVGWANQSLQLLAKDGQTTVA